MFGICESFLGTHHPDSLISINGYALIRKDRSETQDKCGGGLVLFARQSLNVKRRQDLEISNIETIWAEVSLPSSKPFLVCTVYRPPSASAEWTDLFEKELSIAKTTGLEFRLIGDFNIDMLSCSNSKWLNLIQHFDLSQLVKYSTRVTETSSVITDHAYTTDLGNITECFVPSYAISDHFPICFTRKVNCKIPKTEHITTSYRCFKTFDEQHFLADLHHDLCNFVRNRETTNKDFTALHGIIMNHLNKHAPIKIRRVKSSRLPDWYSPKIGQARIARDRCKHLKHLTEYKHYRNKTRNLIRNAKRHHFTKSIENFKDASTLWKYLRAVNNGSTSSGKTLRNYRD